jgi:4-diphosphocytidyl-2-C-methyl-D-erythritol kinase
VTVLAAPAKINLALIVGPLRDDDKHEVVTILQPLALHDDVSLCPAGALSVTGFADDTIVAAALQALAAEADVEPAWHAEITKRIPVAAGLGGGSSDAAAALRLANEALPEPLGPARLAALAAAIGADVPFFLEPGPQLGAGDGTILTQLELPQAFTVVLVLPADVVKASTAEVYARFDARGGAEGFEARRSALFEALSGIHSAVDLASLPDNDLASSPLSGLLHRLGAFRADVSGAGPCVYGLFGEASVAEAAAVELRAYGEVWVTTPAASARPSSRFALRLP